MKKLIIVSSVILASLGTALAQSAPKNPNPNTNGTTTNSGVGNASNGSASPTGAANASGQGAVGANNGTSYGMQTTAPAKTTSASGASSHKNSPVKRSKNN